MKFKLISNWKLDEFTEELNAAQDEGWNCHGNLQTTCDMDGDLWYTMLMFRTDDV